MGLAADPAAAIRSGQGTRTLGQRARLTLRLSAPSIMSQLSGIAMSYIDAAMVGSLGADASASIGLVSTTLWLLWGVGSALAAGFSVQVAHLVGAGKDSDARMLVGQAVTCVLAVTITIAMLGWAVSGPLPGWLGGGDAIRPAASAYFRIVAWGYPVSCMGYLCASLLRCSGNTLVPGVLGVAMCAMDVAFNFLFIFPAHQIHLWGAVLTIPGAGLGVEGAAIGTVAAEVAGTAYLMWYVACRSSRLRVVGPGVGTTFRPQGEVIRKGLRIALPMGGQQTIMQSAQILLTMIVAPLGTAAIAANAFAVTAESLCYAPGFGMADAATTLVGQSVGANRPRLARRFANLTVGLGVCLMTVLGVGLYFGAPLLMAMFTPALDVRSLGVTALQIEAFAEPMYAVSIVAYGAFIGAGDTLVPSVMNLGSIWVVRLPLAAILAGTMGLAGVWTAMCIELIFRGSIFLWRLCTRAWLRGKASPITNPVEAHELERPDEYYELND